MAKMILKVSLLLSFIFIGFVAPAQDVYKTPSGARYHLKTCKMVKNVSEKITLQQSAEKGLEPCKICKTAAMPAPQNLVDKTKGEAKTIQCAGLTKKGTRWQHMTSIANGFCFQHQLKF